MELMQAMHPAELKQFGERMGGYKLRSFEYYHVKEYAQAGQSTLEFFRVDGARQDFSGAIGTVLNISNMVQSGKFDEKFLITGISVYFRPLTTTYASRILDVEKVLSSGQLVLEINHTPVFWMAPIGRCGSPMAFQGFAGGDASTSHGLWSMLKPYKMDPYIYCEENDTLKVTMNWTTVVATTDTNAEIGVFLHGAKYFKA